MLSGIYNLIAYHDYQPVWFQPWGIEEDHPLIDWLLTLAETINPR